MILICWILLIIISLFGIVPMGIWFIWGSFNVLYCLISMLQPKTRLTSIGIIHFIAGIFVSIITGLQLFANYNVINILTK